MCRIMGRGNTLFVRPQIHSTEDGKLEREEAEKSILEIVAEYEGDEEELLHTIYRTVRNSEERNWKPED